MENRKNTTLPPSQLKGQIERFKNHTLNRTDTFTLCSLNTILSSVGYTNNSITLDQTHMKYCLFGSYNGTDTEKINHFTGEEFFTFLPSLLEHPVAIIPSNTMSVQRQLILLDYKLNDSYVCLSVRADGEGRKNAIRFPSTHVFSICAKEKAEYILLKEIENEVEHQKYRNKPCGIYYIDNKKATEMLNSKGFQLPRGFNLNGLINTIQGQSLIVKKNETEKSQNHQIGGFEEKKEIKEEVIMEKVQNSNPKSISSPNDDKTAFLIAQDDEFKSLDKEIGYTLYNRLKDSGVDINLIGDKAIDRLEKSLMKKYGSIMEGCHVYGYEENGRIFINENRISTNVIVHEYTHLWTSAIRSANPLLWEKIKHNVMQSHLFEVFMNDKRYKEISNNADQVVSETLAQICTDGDFYGVAASLEQIMKKDIKDEESLHFALADTYGWVEENVFRRYKHNIDITEITNRLLGDILLQKDITRIKSDYSSENKKFEFNKERALEQGYVRLKDTLLEQFFSLRPTMKNELKEKYIEHYNSLSETSPREACEILTRKIEENAVAYRFFDTVLSKDYPDETFQNHIKTCFKDNSVEDFVSAFETGMMLDVVAGVVDRDRSNIYLHFVNLVARDLFKNDNAITKQILTDFIAKEGKEALRMLYLISGDNMEYKMKLRSMLPTIKYKDEETGKIHTKAETYGILDYDKNMLLSSKYETTYLGKPSMNKQSDLTIEERAITLSDDFQRAFGNINRYNELKDLQDKGMSKDEINTLDWKEKLFISDKNEVKKCAINAVIEGYTIENFYEQQEINKELQRIKKQNDELFTQLKSENEIILSDNEQYVNSYDLNNTNSTYQFPAWEERLIQAKKEREEEKIKAQENASKFYSWTQNAKLPNSNSYLKEHGLDNSIAKNNGVHYNTKFKCMQVPLYSNKTDKLVNLQSIKCERNEEGRWSKYFLKGSDTNVHAKIGDKKSNIVFITEGWATGGAVHNATGELTYCSMSAGNLKNTVDFVKNKHPDTFIVIVADNDRKLENKEAMGIGEIKAMEAGANAVVVIPTIGEDAADYAMKNDLRKLLKDGILTNKEYNIFKEETKKNEEGYNLSMSKI